MSDVFYVLNSNGTQINRTSPVDPAFLVPAKYLVLPGQTIPVADPNGGNYLPTSPTDATLTNPTLYNSDGTVATDQNPDNYLIVPADFSVLNTIAFANKLDSEGLQADPVPTGSLSSLDQVVLAFLENTASSLTPLLSDLINNFASGGKQDLQTTYDNIAGISNNGTGPFVKAFIDAASYNLGLTAYLAGIPLWAVELGGGLYNHITNSSGDQSGVYFNSAVNQNSIVAGYDAGPSVGSAGTLANNPFSTVDGVNIITNPDGTSIHVGTGTNSIVLDYYSASNQEISSVVLFQNDSESTTLFNLGLFPSSLLFGTTNNYDTSNNLTSTVEAFTDNASYTFDAKTDSSVSYNNSTNTTTDDLTTLNGVSVGVAAVDDATNTGTVTLPNGLVINLTSVPTDAVISAVPTSDTPLEALESYLSDLGYTGDLNAANNAYAATLPSDPYTAYTWDGTTITGDATNDLTLTASLFGNDTLTAGSGTGDTLIAGEGVDTLIGSSGGSTDFIAEGGDTGLGSGELTAGSSVTGYGSGNSLGVNGDITGVSITGVQTLLTGASTDTSGNIVTDSITLTNSEWNGFTSIASDESEPVPFSVNFADAGTYNLATKDGGTTTGFNMTALSNGGTTLIGDDGFDQTLTASATGNDTLEAGNGELAQLVAGGGVDTLTGGTGGENAFIAYNGLAAGSSVTGGSDDFLYASGDISGATITGVGTLSVGDEDTDPDPTDITLTATQFGGFSTIGGVDGSTINAATGGTFSLTDANDDNTSFDMDALSDSGTTLEEDNASAGTTLTASASGNDSLISHGAQGVTLDAAGTSGNDTLAATDAQSSTLDVSDSSGSDTLNASGGELNTLDASGSTGNVTMNVTDLLDTIYAGSGADTINGGEFSTIYAGSGNDTIYSGAYSTVHLSGTTDIAGGVVSFTSGAEQIVFSDPTAVIVASGTQATIIGADGTMIVDNDADGHVRNTLNFTAGGSEVDTFTTLTGGAIQEDAIGYTGANGAGTVTYNNVTTLGAAVTLSTGGYYTESNDNLTVDDDISVSITGSGNTATVGNSDGVTFAGTSTNNHVTVTGNSSNVTEAGSNNTTALNGTDNIVYMNAGGNTANVTGSGSDVIDNCMGGDTITMTGSSEDAGLYGNDDVTTASGTDDEVDMYGTGDIMTANGSGENIAIKSAGSDNTVNFSGTDSNIVDEGTGGNTISVTGSSNNAFLGGNDETVTIGGNNNNATITGTGSTTTVSGTNAGIGITDSGNTVDISGTNTTIYDQSAGDNTFSLTGNSDTSVIYTGSGDIIDLAGDNDTVLNSSVGTGGVVDVSGSDDLVNVQSTDGSITVTGTGNSATIYDGTGGNIVTISGSSNTSIIYGSSDTITLNGTGNTISDVGTGSNSISLAGSSNSANLETNDDTATIAGSGNSADITGTGNNVNITGTSDTVYDESIGNNSIALNGSSETAGIFNGTGNDALTVGGTSNTMVVYDNLSGTSGTATISGTNALLTFGGDSNDAITFTSGASGTLLLDYPSDFTGTVAGLASGDSIDLINFVFAHTPTISSVTGTGATGTATNVTITYGSQTETLALLNQYANQYAVSSSAYTLSSDHGTGGGGAGTLFQLAAGH